MTFWVGNAKQAASYYTSRLGFEYFAYKGLETGDRQAVTHVVKKNEIIFAFCSTYGPYENKDPAMGEHLLKHGDGVKDVGFEVEDCKKTYDVAVSRGAKSVLEPTVLKDEKGSVTIATLQTVTI